MKKLSYLEMPQDVIVEVLDEIVNEGFTDVDDIEEIFYDLSDEFFTFKGVDRKMCIVFTSMLRDIFIKISLHKKNLLVD